MKFEANLELIPNPFRVSNTTIKLLNRNAI